MGSLLPTPVDGADPTITTLKSDLKSLRGKVALVESTSSGWAADGSQQRPKGDWEARRLGAAPGAALIAQAEMASREVYSACGIPLSVVTEAEGTGQREGYRRLMHSTIAPLGRIVSEELSGKFETDISLNFDSLFSADLAGRARAFPVACGRRDGPRQSRWAGGFNGYGLESGTAAWQGPAWNGGAKAWQNPHHLALVR